MHVPAEEFPSHDRVLRWHAVRDRTGLSRSTVWRLIRRGSFPKPVTLGPQSVGWIEAELDQWIKARAELRNRSETA